MKRKTNFKRVLSKAFLFIVKICSTRVSKVLGHPANGTYKAVK